MPATRVTHVEPPPEFAVDRTVRLGRHPLLRVFPGLDRVPPFAYYPASRTEQRDVAKGTSIALVGGPTWMYVAPHEVPPFAKAVGWKPVTSASDCIVVGRRHLTKSPAITVYLDILHELFHVFQRRAGRELWDVSMGYADSPIEIEAYEFAVREARRLGASNRYLREYLEVDWIDRKEHTRLVRNLGIPSR
jgi:hypothetical protein